MHTSTKMVTDEEVRRYFEIFETFSEFVEFYSHYESRRVDRALIKLKLSDGLYPCTNHGISSRNYTSHS